MATPTSLYPLRLDPIFQYRLWGGRKLAKLSREGLPGDGPTGEAWILSDRDDFASKVANGSLAGKTIAELIAEYPSELLGVQAGKFTRFPLLLKFLDANEMLSVQVHPADGQKDLLPPGERGKTEAWIVLESEPTSEIYAGLKPGTTAEGMRAKLATGTVEEDLASFNPAVGDALFIEAGTVHALGGGVVVFEVQQNSDVTFRLFDWNRVDAKTGKSRELHIDQAVASSNFAMGPVGPTKPVVQKTSPALRERLFTCEFFNQDRISGDKPFTVGAKDALRVIICTEGSGALAYGTESVEVKTGDVWMLPASLGVLTFTPSGKAVVLETSVPV